MVIKLPESKRQLKAVKLYIIGKLRRYISTVDYLKAKLSNIHS